MLFYFALPQQNNAVSINHEIGKYLLPVSFCLNVLTVALTSVSPLNSVSEVKFVLNLQI